MTKGIEGLQKNLEEFAADTESIALPTQVWWLVNHLTIRERRQNVNLSTSWVVFIGKRCKVAMTLSKKGIKELG